MSDHPPDGDITALARARLCRVREDSLPHWVALVLALTVGLVAASVHWLGLVVGGALVGLVAASLPRALLAGLGFGVLALGVWGAILWLAGSLGPVMATGQLAGVGVVVGLCAPVLGSLARGLV